jgi:hypothetical protein
MLSKYWMGAGKDDIKSFKLKVEIAKASKEEVPQL